MPPIAAFMSGDVLTHGETGRTFMVDLGKVRSIEKNAATPNTLIIDSQPIDLGPTTWAAIEPQVDAALTAGASAVVPPPPVLADITAGSAIITNVSNIAQVVLGHLVSAPGIPAGTTVVGIGPDPASVPPIPANGIKVSAPATASSVGATINLTAVTAGTTVRDELQIARETPLIWRIVRARVRVNETTGARQVLLRENLDETAYVPPGGTVFTRGAAAYAQTISAPGNTLGVVAPSQPWEEIEINNSEGTTDLTVTAGLNTWTVPSSAIMRQHLGTHFESVLTIVGGTAAVIRINLARAGRA